MMDETILCLGICLWHSWNIIELLSGKFSLFTFVFYYTGIWNGVQDINIIQNASQIGQRFLPIMRDNYLGNFNERPAVYFKFTYWFLQCFLECFQKVLAILIPHCENSCGRSEVRDERLYNRFPNHANGNCYNQLFVRFCCNLATRQVVALLDRRFNSI